MHRVFLAGCVALDVAAEGLAVSASELKTSPDVAVMFNIPAEPLAEALVAYEVATGAEVYYDGAMVLGQRSSALQGVYAPTRALEILLGGTGYQPHRTSADTFTLIQGRQAELASRVSQVRLRQHDEYFAALQAAMTDALCDINASPGKRFIVSFRVAGTGTIYGARMLEADDSAFDGGAAIIERINKVNIGSFPPADVPQPITMAVYPPLPQDASGCLSSPNRKTGR